MMKHREIPLPSSDGTAIVRDVLELAALCVEDLRKTSEETDAPGVAVKFSELAHIIALLAEVRARHEPPSPSPTAAAMPGHERLTRAEQAALRRILAKVRTSPPPPPAPPPEGMAGDLTAIALSEISKLLATAREQAYGLLRPSELVGLLELVLRLPPPLAEAQGEPDMTAVAVGELRFLVGYVKPRMDCADRRADDARDQILRTDPALASLAGWD